MGDISKFILRVKSNDNTVNNKSIESLSKFSRYYFKGEDEDIDSITVSLEGKWYDYHKDLQAISKTYPDVTFILYKLNYKTINIFVFQNGKLQIEEDAKIKQSISWQENSGNSELIDDPYTTNTILRKFNNND